MLSTGLVVAAVDTGIVAIVVDGCVVLVVLLATLTLRGQRRQRAQRHDETRRDLDQAQGASSAGRARARHRAGGRRAVA
jgi:hypothetical protein